MLERFLATPGVGRASTTARASTLGTAVHPRVHVHPHVGRRRHDDLQPVAGSATTARSARRGIDRAAAEQADDARRHGQPDDRRASTRRSSTSTTRARPGIDYQTMNTVVVAGRLHGRERLHASRSQRHVGRNQALRYFFNVPAGTPAFKVDFDGPTARRAPARSGSCASTRTASAIEPSTRQPDCYSPPVAGGARRAARSAARPRNPQAGVWEVTVEARRTSDVADRAVHADGVDPRRDASARTRTSSPSATIGVPVARSLHADQPVRRVHRPRGRHDARQRARVATPTIANLAQQQYPVDRHGRLDVAARDDRQHRPTRRPTSTCSSSTARPARASSPGRAPTATPRSR